jgi:hypothetical protein
MALPGNAAMLSILSKLFDSDFALAWGPAIVAPLVEESSKGVGVVMLILLASRHVRTSYDGFILGAFVGLGFQVFEDWMYGVNASAAAFGFDQVHNSFSTFLSRGLMAGLVSHALYTALVGAGVGAWVQSRGKPLGARLPGTVGPIAAAVLLHGMWDYGATVGYPVVIALTAISAIILVVIIGRWTNRQLRPWMSELLAPEVVGGLITEGELSAMVGSPRDRRHYVHSAKKGHGKAAGKATRHVLDAELDLAEALGQSDGTESETVDDARSELQRLRQELDATLAAA